jgi:thymidylate kinase
MDRTLPAVIAVVGCDGSGKSTLSRWLVEELGKHQETRFIYFGTGDGPGSRLRRTLNWLKKKSRYGKPSVAADLSPSADTARAGNFEQGINQPEADGNPSPSSTDKAPDALRLVWAAAVLAERLGKMRELRHAADAGVMIVTDRYPQAEFWGIHDGPRLGYLLETRTTGLLYRIACWEQAAYLKIAQRKPDMVMLLDVSVEMAHQRRPEEPIDELKKRIHVARSLTFQGAHRVVLDSSEPLKVVQEKALQAVLDKPPDNTARDVNARLHEGVTKQTIDS